MSPSEIRLNACLLQERSRAVRQTTVLRAIFALSARVLVGASLLVACGSDAPPSTKTSGSGGLASAGHTSTGGTQAVTAGSGGASGGASSAAGRASSSGGTSNGANGGRTSAAGRGNGGNNSSGGRTGTTASSGGSSGANTTGGANAMGGRGGTTANGGRAGASSGGAGTSGTAGAPAGWTLAWSDEFDGPSGQSPDSTKWAYDVGGDGWGNSELEYYTSRPDNSATDGSGHLVITLQAETYMNRSYTSARLKTQGKFTQAYGRFESRIKIPRGQGIWPAFWMLGDDISTNPWPACGEIDVMENVGKEPSINHGSMHGPGYSGGNPLTGSYTLAGAALADDFHVYAIEWETNVVRFYVDESNYETRKNTDVPSGAKWVYDHPFFMLLNIAIGGSFPGPPDGTTMLPQTMTVDYVRVYTKS